MEAVLQWGLDCIRLIQGGASRPLTILMLGITKLGSIGAYIIYLPLIYWCVNEKKGLRLAIMVMLSAWINLILKLALDQPRPFFEAYDPSVGMISESMGGFPSGHAQNALVMWIITASWGKKKWQWRAAAVFCLLMGFSRVYLGVHFPTDIFGGWLIGGILLAVYFLVGDRIESLLAEHSPRAGLIACAALAFVMILYRPSIQIVVPAAVILGFVCGFYLCKQHIGFTAQALGSNRIGIARYLVLLVRFLLGITVLALLYVLSGKIIAAVHISGNIDLFIFLRFALLSLWVSAGAPWLFRFVRLADMD